MQCVAVAGNACGTTVQAAQPLGMLVAPQYRRRQAAMHTPLATGNACGGAVQADMDTIMGICTAIVTVAVHVVRAVPMDMERADDMQSLAKLTIGKTYH